MWRLQCSGPGTDWQKREATVDWTPEINHPNVCKRASYVKNHV